MNMFFSLFVFVAAAVTAVPLVFNPGLLRGDDARFFSVHHGAHFPGADAKLRFLHLVPMLGAEFDHFATEGKGLTPVRLDFLWFDAGEVLDHFVGVSDCATWHAGVFANWTPLGMVHHAFTGEKGAAGFTGALVDMPAAVDFVHGKFPTTEVFKKFVAAGLPTHVFTFMLHKAFRLTL